MAETGMMDKSVALAEKVRASGGKVSFVPIMFKPDASDNPNKRLGILAGCFKDSRLAETGLLTCKLQLVARIP